MGSQTGLHLACERVWTPITWRTPGCRVRTSTQLCCLLMPFQAVPGRSCPVAAEYDGPKFCKICTVEFNSWTAFRNHARSYADGSCCRIHRPRTSPTPKRPVPVFPAEGIAQPFEHAGIHQCQIALYPNGAEVLVSTDSQNREVSLDRDRSCSYFGCHTWHLFLTLPLSQSRFT